MTKRKTIVSVVILILFIILSYVGYITYKKASDFYFYYNESQNIPKSQKIDIKNYKELPSMMESWPGITKLITASEYQNLRGNNKVKKIDQADKKQISIDLYFAEPDEKGDSNKRSALIVYRPKQPLNLNDMLLFTTVSTRGPIVGKGHQQSRIQFELEDINGKTMRGPKMPLLDNGEKTYLVIRPTVNEPIPMGSAKLGFNPGKVAKITFRFIIAHYPDGISSFPAQGKLYLDTLYLISNPAIVTKFFGEPDIQRITTDNPNLAYKLRKISWSREDQKFFIGINYPWHNYGWDVGRNPYGEPANSGWSSREKQLRDDFTLFKESFGEFLGPIRIYLFFDFRSGLNYTAGNLTGFDAYVRKDIETMIKVAGETGIKLNLVLFDFGIADGQGAPGQGDHPEIIFSSEKYNFLKNLMIPLLRDMERWDNQYGNPVFALELMNEPENMAALIIPGYFQSLKTWFKDLANIIHNETSFKVTLGSHSVVDMQKWWADVDIDIRQFHFYNYMAYEHDQLPQKLLRQDIKIPGIIFCGEMQPSDISQNIEAIKNNGYNGLLFWSWNQDDGYKLRNSKEFQEIVEWVQKNSTKAKEAN